ncbi:MAG: hypothetical protein D6772_14265, partial [Bacteroidetes bacterium]
MQTFYLLLFLILSVSLGFTQDTIRVQTFTWADETRSKMFQFPDNPDETYEQILMRYNMRCHDAAVRPDNRPGFVGCGEWDYSCNTFIYDPERMDSVQRSHPSHLISRAYEGVFPYRDTPPYEYFQFTQYETTFSDTSQLTIGELGMNSGSGVPLNPGRPLRQQYLYRADELLAAGLSAGPLTALHLHLQQGNATIPFLRLRLRAVEVDTLQEDQPVVDGFTTVYFRNTTLAAANDWHSLPFYQDFIWDGTSNILLDVSMLPSPAGEEVLHGLSTTNYPSAAFPSPNTDPSHYVAFNGQGWMEIDTDTGGPLDAITVAFWANGLPASFRRNTSVFEAVDTAGRRQLNVHLPWSNNRVYWDCGNDGTGYDRIDKAIDSTLLTGPWNHWAFTKDALSGEMKIYLNGELWHEGSGKFRTIDLERTVFGANANFGNRWPGSLDQISIWRTALTGEEVRALMFDEQPSGVNLSLHYALNEGQGFTAEAQVAGYTARLFGPNWQTYRPEEQRHDWQVAPFRWHLRFEQGVYTRQVNEVTVLDSQLLSPLTVRAFEVNDRNDLQLANEYETYPGDMTFIYDEAGSVVDTIFLVADGQIEVQTLRYFQRIPQAKFEILSLVTPYGIGLDLGQAGKTFTFDVTDYAPILKGEKRLSLEMGGQNQEEMDIEFLFIKGTPPRPVLDVANVWPFARGWYQPIVDDDLFEPRVMPLAPEGDAFKLRASVTGHGQNGEFIPREHYLNLNGGSQDFRFDVWKACSQNPIYPQGGTWIFDRAGWC